MYHGGGFPAEPNSYRTSFITMNQTVFCQQNPETSKILGKGRQTIVHRKLLLCIMIKIQVLLLYKQLSFSVQRHRKEVLT